MAETVAVGVTTAPRHAAAILLAVFAVIAWFGATFVRLNPWLTFTLIGMHLFGAAGLLTGKRWGSGAALACAGLWLLTIALSLPTIISLPHRGLRGVAVEGVLLTINLGVGTAWVLTARLAFSFVRGPFRLLQI